MVRLPLLPEDGYQIDLDQMLDQLAGLATPGTKLIALSNPNNPTGALLGPDQLARLAEIAAGCGAYILCDEVYRGLEREDPGSTPSIADLYDRGISTGSMSKAFSLAGLRLGWIAGPAEVIERVMIHRDYTTISVGMVDDYLATLALENAETVLARSRTITDENFAVLAEWVESEPLLNWVQPGGGSTALVHYELPITAREFCVQLLEETGVMFTPGSVLGVEHAVRIGYACDGKVLKAGLDRTSDFLAKQ